MITQKKIVYKELYNRNITFSKCFVAWFSYADETKILTVTFANGNQYNYLDVSKKEINSVLGSQNRLRELSTLIKQKTPVFIQKFSAEYIQLGTMRNSNYRNLAR